MNTFIAIDASKLTRKQKKKALRTLSIIKGKRDSTIKGRTCTDGRKQRLWKTKQESASPTVHTDSVMLSMIVGAHEKRSIAVGDFKGAYLNAIMDEFLHVRLEGEQVEIMCRINPECLKHATKERGTKVLHLALNKALCGCVQSALLWCKLLVDPS